MRRTLRFKVGKTARDRDAVLRLRVRSAYRYIPAYRRLLDECSLRPERIRTVADLPLLPMVEKERLFRTEELRETVHVRARPDRLVRAGTSGSTGLPLNVYMSHGEALFRRALLLRTWRRFGPLPARLRVTDMGGWVTSDSGVEVKHRGLVTVTRILIALPPEQQIELLGRYRPHIVSGYPTAIDILADALLSRPLREPPRLVATRGEVVHDIVRRSIERGFACRTADFYNCEEVGNVAWECPHDSHVLHVNTDACVVEVVDSSGAPLATGEEGWILVTNLFNFTMPFIRYGLHDRGLLLPPSAGRCACGSRAPRMGLVSGRDDDDVYLPDGRRVSPRLIATAVNRAFSEFSPVGAFDRHFRRFQVIQDGAEHLTVRIQPEAGHRMAFEEIINVGLRRIHPGLRCRVVLLDELPREPSGKFRKVIRTFDA